MDVGELVVLAGRRWYILEKLRQRKYYVSELAKELGKVPPEISKNLRDLEKNGLLQCEQGEGRRKYYYPSDFAKRILGALDEATQSRPKEKLEEWKINELLSVLEDQNLSESVRDSYAKTFHNICRQHPEVVIVHGNIQELFEKALTEPVHDKAGRILMRAMTNILPHSLKDEKGRRWVLEKLYPSLVKNAENKQASEKIRSQAVSKVAQIASLSGETSLEHQAEKMLLEILFSEDTDKDSELGKEVRQQLACLASKHLFEDVRAKAKDPKLKEKAEILLQDLRECLLPK